MENRKVYRAESFGAQTTRYADIQRILDEGVEGQDIHAHRAFSRDLTRDEFVVKKI